MPRAGLAKDGQSQLRSVAPDAGVLPLILADGLKKQEGLNIGKGQTSLNSPDFWRS
jgi:hypothetical protein